MNKVGLISPFILLCSLLISVSSSSGADFRNNDWGDSPAEVMHYEGEVLPWIGGGPYSNNKIFTEWFAYSKKYLGIESSVFFKFTPEEKLGVGFCVPVEGRIKPFYLWEAALSDLFGETENRDDLLTEDNVILAHYYYGDAAAVEEGILSGYFALVRHWETETTNIWLVAELYDGKLEVHVNYYSKEYFDFFREEKKRNGPHAGLRPWFDDDSQ